MSHINRPRGQNTSSRSIESAPTSERPAHTTASTLHVRPRAAGLFQGLMQAPVDAQTGVPSTSFSTHLRQQANMYLSLTEYLLAPPGIFSKGASPVKHPAGMVALSSQRFTTTPPYQLPLSAMPPDSQNLEKNVAVSPPTHQGQVLSRPDDWAESMFALAGFGAPAAPQLLPTSRLAPTEAGSAPGLQTYHEPTPGDASSRQGDWLDLLFGPHALEKNALSSADMHAPLIAQAYDETSVAQSGSRPHALFDLSADWQDFPSRSTVASNGQQVAGHRLMDFDFAMRDAFALEQQSHDLFLNNLVEIPTESSVAFSGAVQERNEVRQRSLVCEPDALNAANGVGKDANTVKRRRKDSNKADPQAEERAASGMQKQTDRSVPWGRRLVDPNTGNVVPQGTPGGISQKSYSKRKLVDPQTGRPVAPETPGAIKRSLYYSRQPVDPQTGRRVPVGTPGAVSRSSFQSVKLIDPQTGQRVAPGRPGAITYRAFSNRRLVDPETGAAVADGTPGAINRGRYWDRLLRPVDPETGKPVPRSTPGAITLKAFLSRKQNPDV